MMLSSLCVVYGMLCRWCTCVIKSSSICHIALTNLLTLAFDEFASHILSLIDIEQYNTIVQYRGIDIFELSPKLPNPKLPTPPMLSSLRAVLVGSGSDGMQLSQICKECIRLTNKAAADINVLYIGTASYDNIAAATNQTKTFLSLGATVNSLILSDDKAAAKPKFEMADIIVVSGGNTLFAVDRWKHLGIDVLFTEAQERGVVLAGGSAGAIVAFESGHSDSGDPESFYIKGEADPSWKYVRVPGLSLLPGLCCPHYDKIQSNGILRATDFSAMMTRHANERGIGIDHWAALSIEG